jgi:hypothetical protein
VTKKKTKKMQKETLRWVLIQVVKRVFQEEDEEDTKGDVKRQVPRIIVFNPNVKGLVSDYQHETREKTSKSMSKVFEDTIETLKSIEALQSTFGESRIYVNFMTNLYLTDFVSHCRGSRKNGRVVNLFRDCKE